MTETKLNIVPACEFLKDAKGIIHIGASIGHERDIYAARSCPVVWIEPIPDVFMRLAENIAGYPHQRALRYLIADKDGEPRKFHVANNGGMSSSLFEFGEHKKLWPTIDYVDSLEMESLTLQTALRRAAVNLDEYDTLILDVQGAELLVLKGAGDLLDKFKFIRCEAADFELYKGGCLLKDLDQYLLPRGFSRVQTWVYAHKDTGETTGQYEALYQKTQERQKRQSQLAPIYIHDEQTGAKALYRVGALTSVPRLGFQAHAGALERAFGEIPILRTRGVFWEACMQNGMNRLIRDGADYIITVDYDSIFTAEDVKELLRLVVRYPDADAIAAWQASRAISHKPLAGVRKDNGWGGQVDTGVMKETDLTPVDNTVYGLTVIKTAAIQKMPKPWFLNVPNEDGEWEHGKHDADSYFWWKFREAGNSLYMANRVRIGHLHEDILWLDDDFNLIKQDLVEYYSKGRPF
jgi:FkbM family methyltransferase